MRTQFIRAVKGEIARPDPHVGTAAGADAVGHNHSFARAASPPPAAAPESDYLSYLSYCASAYERMDAIGERLLSLDLGAGRALRDLERRARDRQEQVDRLRARAALRDGRRVYMTRDGCAGYYEEGDPMPRREFELTKWGRNVTPWEEYCHAIAILDRLLQEHAAVSAYRQRIVAKRRGMLSDEPVAAAVLDVIERELSNMPDAVRRNVAAPSAFNHSAAHDYMGDHGFSKEPGAREEFNRAATRQGDNRRTTSRSTARHRAPAPGTKI